MGMLNDSIDLVIIVFAGTALNIFEERSLVATLPCARTMLVPASSIANVFLDCG